MRLLLLSNSTNSGEAYMQWSAPVIADFLKNENHKLCFIPYAGVGLSSEEYTQKVAQALAKFSIEVLDINSYNNPQEAIREASALAVGGGNTFQLFAKLHELNLMETIKNKVASGMPFMGWSAGSNVACPSLKTTNDMPIVQPKSFEGLSLISAQINPHYTNKTIVGHGGESRNQRIIEFLELNQNASVLGLPEGSYIEIDGDNAFYYGSENLNIFSYNSPIISLPSESKLNAFVFV